MSAMSTSSGGSRGVYRRIESLRGPRLSRTSSSSPKTSVTRHDAYTYALRGAYLCHLLSPRPRRVQQSIQNGRPQVQRHTTSVADLVKDWRDSKSTRFPSGFMSELNKRLEGVLMGRERMPEYNDGMVKRTFAAFLNEFKKPDIRKTADYDRRLEHLVLVFFSSATKELQKGKAPEDQTWKWTVDRHVALFVRLLSATLKGNDWARERPELSNQLQVLEGKLLTHDQDLSIQRGSDAQSIEVEVARSKDVKDMHMVLRVATIFKRTLPQVNSDIAEQKDLWTEQAALQDLKLYQTYLNTNTRRTLRSEDFDTEDAYETWKMSEFTELSQMVTQIVQYYPELAKSAPRTQLPKSTDISTGNETFPGSPRRLSETDYSNGYFFDQPVDMSGMSLRDGNSFVEVEPDDGEPFIFIPPDPRECYRFLLREALTVDLQDASYNKPASGDQPLTLLSEQSAGLLHEMGTRWRVPLMSRMMLFLDVIREKFIAEEIDLETLDAAFSFMKEPPFSEPRGDTSSLFDRTKWTMADYVLNQQILSSIHDTLLRNLFEQLQTCFDAKLPMIGPLMTVLETHIYDDPQLSRTPEDLDRFSYELQESLREKALEIYNDIFETEIRQHEEGLEFYHVLQLGRSVLKFADKIQKRYRKMPKIMGVDPFIILVETMLPAFVADARDQVTAILERSESSGNKVPIQDGFDLYKEMLEIRQVHHEVLPSAPFNFNVEATLAVFVWRWLSATEENIMNWVDGAVNQDKFLLNSQTLSETERYSSSVVDVFRSLSQSIEQISGLNWDNDVQYAEFMTASAKLVEIGLARYCDLVERMFNKEMDRPTPEQELQLTQTRQEKWLRMAKDVVTAKEKVEPYEFFAESFVKLNDIEFAMLQLDKMEKDINVDACAEVLARNKSTSGVPQWKPDKYVFNIKIIEAEDLRACDMNGLSDPYVVLGDEYQKRLAKTRIIYGNLNPRWEETVDISTTGPLNIIATIWDWDMLKDHDCVGRTSIKLDPTHFRDFLPREYWLNLDTQGRLLVRVSMEGEKDDIQFYFGKTFRALKRTERDMTRKITDKLSAYIHYCLSRRALASLTGKTITSSLSSYLQRTRAAPPVKTGPTNAEITEAINPLFTYFNENFAVMKETLTSTAMVAVMARVWKEVLSTIETLLVPPLSDKLSLQKPLLEQELNAVYKWLELLFAFFHAVDDETGEEQGVPLDVLKNQKYHDLQHLAYFYLEPTDALVRSSERIASAGAARVRAQPSRFSAPPAAGQVYGAVATLPSARRTKSVMLCRNLGTMRKAKEDRRKESQAEPSDDMLLRILRMRPEAERYLRDRARQKERLAAAAAAELIVRQSLAGAQAGVGWR